MTHFKKFPLPEAVTVGMSYDVDNEMSLLSLWLKTMMGYFEHSVAEIRRLVMVNNTCSV